MEEELQQLRNQLAERDELIVALRERVAELEEANDELRTELASKARVRRSVPVHQPPPPSTPPPPSSIASSAASPTSPLAPSSPSESPERPVTPAAFKVGAPTPSAAALIQGGRQRRAPPTLLGSSRHNVLVQPPPPQAQPLPPQAQPPPPQAPAASGEPAEVSKWCSSRAPEAKAEEKVEEKKEEAAFDPSRLCYVHCRGKEPSLSRYYLGIDKPLASHVLLLCLKFNIEESEAPRYALQLSGNKHHIAAEEFDAPAEFVLPPDTTLSLTLHPIHTVGNVLQTLRDPDSTLTRRKAAVFQLRCKIVDDEDDEVLEEVVRQQGVVDLMNELESEETLPSYGSILLSCIARLFGSTVLPEEQISDAWLRAIAKNVLNVNVQLQRPALDAYAGTTARSSRSYAELVSPLVQAAEQRCVFTVLVSMLESFDAAVQKSALWLINALIQKAIDGGIRKECLEKLDAAGIAEKVKNQIVLNSSEIRNELHDYQILRLDRVKADVVESVAEASEGSSAAEMLKKGWSMLSKQPFPGLVSPAWSEIGFATDTPLRELDNMLYIRTWLHYIEHYADHLKRLQAKGYSFPYSCASIGITTQLIGLFAINNVGKKHVFPLLLNSASVSGSVFGELHALGIRQLSTQWKNLKCSDVNDLKKLIPMMRVIFEETIVYLRPESLSKLKLLMEKQSRDVSMLSEVSRSGGAKPKEKKLSRSGLLRKSRRNEKEIRKPEVELYGGDLIEIMDYERKEDSTATIPRLVSYLIESLFAKGGTQTEGIFRISVKMDVLVELKQRLNCGDFDIEFPSAHYPAALLKQFLRDLKVELIPGKFYNDCLAANEDAATSAEILRQLPVDHFNVVKHLLIFMRELGKPEYNSITKMGFSNLALVFAPAFFRPDLTDQAGMLAKSDMERAFITNLLEHLPELNL